MEEIYTACLDRLMARCPDLAHIDLNYGQLNSQGEPPLAYPAALFRFQVPQYEEVALGTRKGEMVITVQLVHRVYARTSSIEVAPFREHGLEHLRLNERVKWALQGVSGEDFTALVAFGFDDDDRPDLRVYNLTFTTTVTERPPILKFISWNQAGKTGAGPDLCLTDQGNPVI
jgi:hypothetical protein